MDKLDFSFIIPVYNRPNEIKELLSSFEKLIYDDPFEILIIEDGSEVSSETVVQEFQNKLNISYYYKSNSGPGDSRNFGMNKAKGNYFIILDSDCILPPQYLSVVNEQLKREFVDCYGGPDAANQTFSNLQKAINFSMTSFMTTGGIRGGTNKLSDFQPRSFNMGISKNAFEATGGFGSIHPGEDPDLSIRLKCLGFRTKLIKEAFVYHKRRISWNKFYQQVHKFGLVRPILNKWHPHTNKLIYWLPSVFSLGFILALGLLFVHLNWLILLYGVYFIIAFTVALIDTKNLVVSLQSMLAILIQFFGYGLGFLKASFLLKISNKLPEQQFPKLFFKHGK